MSPIATARRTATGSRVCRVLGVIAATFLLVIALSASSCHYTRTVTSPDGAWELFVDTHDQGALGGDTQVTLRKADGGHEVVLYDGGWMDDSDIGWLDARTVNIGRQMPFVEHAIDTGSSQTTGTSIDARGYVHNTIAAGERTFMLSGLSFVLPDQRTGELLTLPKPNDSDPSQELSPSTPGAWPYRLLTLHDVAGAPLWSKIAKGRLLAGHRNGRLEVCWVAGSHQVVIVTRLHSGAIGLLIDGRVYASAAAARSAAERMWELLAVQGAGLTGQWSD